MKFTHGQRVTCKIDGVEIKDAKISINRDGTPFICHFICQNEQGWVVAENMLGYKYSWLIDRDFTHPDVTDLKPVEKTWENLEKGDVIVDTDGDGAVVLTVLDGVFLRSSWGNHKQAAVWYTVEEAQNKGFKIKQDPQPVDDILELTLEDVAKLKGVDVSKIRIKE